jgi:hypothetical protein
MLTGLMPVVLLAAAAPPEAEFLASSPAKAQPVGRLVTLTPDGVVTLETADGKVAVRDVVSLRRTDLPLPPLPRGPELVTTTGDRIPGRLVGGDAQRLRFLPDGGLVPEMAWAVPYSSAAFVWLTRTPAETPPDPARDSWLGGDRNRDLVRLRNKDVISGTLDGFVADPVALRFTSDTGAARTIALTEVAALAFNPSLARIRKPKGPYAHLVLRNGMRVDITSPIADRETIRGRTLFGQAVEFPLTDLVALSVYQGKAAYLSDLKPKKVEQAGYLGTAWPFASDRTVRGRPLRLNTAAGKETFDKGLGTHPQTTLVYDIAGKYSRFEALVGLDAETGRRGQASVRVLVDGKEQTLPTLQRLTAGQAARVRLDIGGAKELTLVVDFAPTGGAWGDVNWADARVLE